MRTNHWYTIGHNKMMQAIFWGWWEGLSVFRRSLGQYAYIVNDDGLSVKIPKKVMVTLRELYQEFAE